MAEWQAEVGPGIQVLNYSIASFTLIIFNFVVVWL